MLNTQKYFLFASQQATEQVFFFSLWKSTQRRKVHGTATGKERTFLKWTLLSNNPPSKLWPLGLSGTKEGFFFFFSVRAETLHASALARVFKFRKRRAEERGNTSTFSCRHASPGLEEQRRKAGGLRRQEIKHKMKTSLGLKRSRLAFLNFPNWRAEIKNRSRGQEENGDKRLLFSFTAAQSSTHGVACADLKLHAAT